MAYSDSPYDPPQRPARALRLIFSYKGSRTKLESKHSIEMMALPSDTTEDYKDRSGFWVELRDKQERVVYRRIMRNPIQVELEAPSGREERTGNPAGTEPENAFALFERAGHARLLRDLQGRRRRGSHLRVLPNKGC